MFDAFCPSEDLQLYGRGPAQCACRPCSPATSGACGWSTRSSSRCRARRCSSTARRSGWRENRDIPGRLAVRSPMQWSADRQRRLLDARPPSDLCRPVTAPRASTRPPSTRWPSGATRARCSTGSSASSGAGAESPEIGHGTLHPLATGDPAVLAHRCDWEDRTIVAVHNLAGRPARVDLERLADDGGRGAHRPVRHARPGRGARRALRLDLEPYGQRWFAGRRAAGSRPAPTAATTPRAATRKDLYERARKLGIPGRSTMTKDELAAALARAR